MNEGFGLKNLLSDVKKHLKTEIEYGKLTAVEKASVLCSKVALASVLVIVGCFVVYYLTSSFVVLLTQWIGSEWVARLLMGVILLVAMLLVYAFRKQWIINPITRFISKLFLKPDDNE